MKNLKKFNKIKNKFFLLIIIFILLSKSLSASNNKIVFKINDKAFTLFDVNKRIEYLNFVGNNDQLSKKIIIDDYISANLFYEYHKKNISIDNYEEKVVEIFNNILETNEKNNKKYNYKIDKKNIISNITLDYVRKTVLESILNSSLEKFQTSKEEIDLIYNIKLKYLNIKKMIY